MDDRSLKCPPRAAGLRPSPPPWPQLRLTGNIAKRQQWNNEEIVEQGGLAPALPKPRDRWEPIRLVIRRLALLPGPVATRERLETLFMAPKWSWASPLVVPCTPSSGRPSVP